MEKGEGGWYVVKQVSEQCQIIDAQSLEDLKNSTEQQDSAPQVLNEWGPFDSKGEAIAKRVGLIRAGKCKPV